MHNLVCKEKKTFLYFLFSNVYKEIYLITFDTIKDEYLM